MKKILSILILTLTLGLVGVNQTIAAECADCPAKKQMPEKQKIRQDFEKRLNLTEKQKEKAQKIHQKGAEQMKPIMKKMAELRKEIGQIKKSDLEESAKQQQIDKKFEEMKKLDSKAKEIRKQNSKEFEKILTKEQKEELAKMKAEGRKRFEMNHPPRPPFGMFGLGFKEGEKPVYPVPRPILPPKFEK